MRSKLAGMIAAACVLAPPVVRADLSADLRAVRSEVQAMGHGYHSAAEWRAVQNRLAELARRAEATERWEEWVEIRLLWAMVLADMLGDHVEALQVLQEVRARCGHLRLPALRKVYVREAEVLAHLGDEEAIRRLIREFKASPHYDGERYPYSGGWGREVPLQITRPFPRGSESITVTAMEKALAAAHWAPGRACPPFEATDSLGRRARLEDFRGKVLILDFWSTRWPSWRARLPVLRELYFAYGGRGLEILGISIDPDSGAARSFAAQERLPWRLVFDDPRLPALFGVFGETGNIVVDRHGVVVGRNLEGAELKRVVRSALGVER